MVRLVRASARWRIPCPHSGADTVQFRASVESTAGVGIKKRRCGRRDDGYGAVRTRGDDSRSQPVRTVRVSHRERTATSIGASPCNRHAARLTRSSFRQRWARETGGSPGTCCGVLVVGRDLVRCREGGKDNGCARTPWPFADRRTPTRPCAKWSRVSIRSRSCGGRTGHHCGTQVSPCGRPRRVGLRRNGVGGAHLRWSASAG